jgi:glycyl-tRNA synthetase beta chain
MKALESVTTKPEFDPLIVGFKRAHRLVEKEEKNRWVRQPVNRALFQHPSETKLREAWEKNDQLVRHLIAERKYSKALEAFVSMKPAIDDFFTAVMVNADDPSIRINRLSLLKDIDELFLLFADFSQIVVQGS